MPCILLTQYSVNDILSYRKDLVSYLVYMLREPILIKGSYRNKEASTTSSCCLGPKALVNRKPLIRLAI